MGPFQHDGVWWDPHDPSEQWIGTVRFDECNGIVLRLIVPVKKPVLFPTSRTHVLLLGLTSAGEAITLIDCYGTSSTGSFGPPRAIEVEANAIIVGFHADRPDPLLSSATVSFRHLSDWSGRSGLEWDSSVKQPDAQIRYTAADAMLVHDSGRFRVSLRSAVSGSVGKGRANLREQTGFELRASTPTPLSEFQRLVQACGDFLSVACLTLSETEELVLVPPVVGGVVTRTGTYHAVPLYQDRRRRSSVVAHMLLRFNQVEHRVADLIDSWLSRAEELRDVRALYLAGAYGGGFVEGKLVFLTQAVEAFHRRFHDGLYIDQKRFRSTVLRPLLAAIPDGTDEGVRKSVTARLRHANDYSQRDRLDFLVRRYEAALQILVAHPMVYVEAIVDHRNAFTHFDPKSRKSSGEDPIQPERVVLYNFFLRLLLEAGFLEVMGFTTAEITELFRRSETYRQLSVRFRDWQVPPPLGEVRTD